MKHFCQTGAEIVENVSFGKHPATTKSRWGTKADSAGAWNFRAFKGIIGATCVIPGKIYRGNG